MALRYSTRFRNIVASFGWKRALQGGAILIYTGSQPASANDAVSGTLLATLTSNSLSRTNEVRASATITLSGASGSVNTVTVNSYALIGAAVPFNTSLTQTAADLATAINKFASPLGFEATSSGAVVTVLAPMTAGTMFNGQALAATATTLGATSSGNMTGGVASVNALDFGAISNGVIAKDAAQVWSGVAGATGVAGWFRFVGSIADAGAADSTAQFARMDGSIATSGADMNITNTTISTTAVQTVSVFQLTMPS